MFTQLPNLETAQAFANTNNLRQRVCVYITRNLELLVFLHETKYPTTGIQIPAGGLEHDETIFEAATRETFEETGLTNLEPKKHLGSGLFQSGKRQEIWHFIWLETTETRDTWAHFAEEKYVFYHRFEKLEQVTLHYSMDAMLPELGKHLGLELPPMQTDKRPCVICYITRGHEILTFTGHPDGGIGVPAGGIEEGETPEEAAKREILEESGLSLENPVFLGRQEYYFQGTHPENDTPLEFYEDRYYYWFKTTETRDNWDWVVSDGEDDKGKVFKHSFVPLEQAKIDWEMDEFIPQVKNKS
jgi:8-oxo-dGTP pyrophosphatase MutT (NUDIX family)